MDDVTEPEPEPEPEPEAETAVARRARRRQPAPALRETTDAGRVRGRPVEPAGPLRWFTGQERR